MKHYTIMYKFTNKNSKYNEIINFLSLINQNVECMKWEYSVGGKIPPSLYRKTPWGANLTVKFHEHRRI